MALYIHNDDGTTSTILSEDEEDELIESENRGFRNLLGIGLIIGVIVGLVYGYDAYKNREHVKISYYDNGNIKTKQTYKNQKLNGLSVSYYENGNIKTEQMYSNNQKNGWSKIYFMNGMLRTKAMMKNNKLNGESILYDETGNIIRKDNFIDGNSTNIIE